MPVVFFSVRLLIPEIVRGSATASLPSKGRGRTRPSRARVNTGVAEHRYLQTDAAGCRHPHTTCHQLPTRTVAGRLHGATGGGTGLDHWAAGGGTGRDYWAAGVGLAGITGQQGWDWPGLLGSRGGTGLDYWAAGGGTGRDHWAAG